MLTSLHPLNRDFTWTSGPTSPHFLTHAQVAAFDRDAARQLKVWHLEGTNLSGVGLCLERLVRNAEVCRPGAGDHARNHDVSGKVRDRVPELL